MAEERNLVPTGAPAADAASTDAAKLELQRRMEEAREQISQTVTEIKETVVNQYQQVRSSINDSLDWREQYRRRPIPFTAGAFGAGLLLGYAIAGTFEDDDEDDHAEAFGRIERGFDRIGQSGVSSKPYAASPILGAAANFGSSDLSRPALPEQGTTSTGSSSAYSRQSGSDVGPDTRSTLGGGYSPVGESSQATSQETGQATGGVSASLGSFASSLGQQTETEDTTPKGPSLFDRFKETKAYDRLQEELTTIGDRVVEELSRTAQTVILPALLSKLKDLIGVDLGTQRQVAQRTRLETEAAQQQQTANATNEGQSSGQQSGGQGGSGSANFATSGGRGF
jgi:ElaB/YqjD/DUF883 family membrane-anchored ribosome-binding protein